MKNLQYKGCDVTFNTFTNKNNELCFLTSKEAKLPAKVNKKLADEILEALNNDSNRIKDLMERSNCR